MKEQALNSGTRDALQSLVGLAGALGVGSLLASRLFTRRGKREQDVGLTVFETFVVVTVLVMSGVSAYLSVQILQTEEAISGGLFTAVATPLVLSIVLLALLVAVARFSNLHGGIGNHLSALALTVFMALVAGFMISLLRLGVLYVVPADVGILLLAGGIAWVFLRVERWDSSGSLTMMRRRTVERATSGYRPTEAAVLPSLPERHPSEKSLNLVCWLKKGRTYLDYPSSRRLRNETHQRWTGLEEGATMAPTGDVVLMNVELKLHLLPWPPRNRLTVTIYERGAPEPETHTLQADDAGLIDITDLGLIQARAAE
jgi:hypothetical protein